LFAILVLKASSGIPDLAPPHSPRQSTPFCLYVFYPHHSGAENSLCYNGRKTLLGKGESTGDYLLLQCQHYSLENNLGLAQK